MAIQFAILGREESARCQYSHKKGECFRAQIPVGTLTVCISANALLQEIRKAGIQAALDDNLTQGRTPDPTGMTSEMPKSQDSSTGKGRTRSAAKTT